MEPGLYHWPSVDNVNLLEVIIQDVRRVIRVKGLNKMMSVEELYEGLEKLM